jgi:hypothetical protein
MSLATATTSMATGNICSYPAGGYYHSDGWLRWLRTGIWNGVKRATDAGRRPVRLAKAMPFPFPITRLRHDVAPCTFQLFGRTTSNALIPAAVLFFIVLDREGGWQLAGLGLCFSCSQVQPTGFVGTCARVMEPREQNPMRLSILAACSRALRGPRTAGGQMISFQLIASIQLIASKIQSC